MAASPVATSAQVPGDDDFGARALHGQTWSVPEPSASAVTRFGPVYLESPPVENVLRVEPAYYEDGCHVGRTRTTLVPGCVYGDPDGDVRVAVVGDSKVGRYFPALEEIARREGWALRMYTKSSCAFIDEPDESYPACEDYKEDLRAELAADVPDIVITTSIRRHVEDGYVRTWEWLEDLGTQHVVALWDSPSPTGTPPECVAEAQESGADLGSCAATLDDDISGNPSLRGAAARVDIAEFVDLRDWVCPDSGLSPLCPVVVGRAQVFGSGSHLAQTFTETLTDPLHQRLHEAGVTAYRPSVGRVGGLNRYDTAARLSQDVPVGGRVFVASGDDYPDALAAAARAGDGRSAILLTREDSVPSVTREALSRLDPRQIGVVGGREKISSEVMGELLAYTRDVVRVAGTTRYGTAAAVAELDPAPRGGTVYVASGLDFPDALAAAARAGAEDSAILLVKDDSVPSQTVEALERLAPSRIVLAGGTTAVQDKVARQLGQITGAMVERRGGGDRYETAALLAQDVEPGHETYAASGALFPDALAAAPLAAASDGAVVLVKADGVPGRTTEAVTRLRPSQMVLVGGQAAADEEVRRELIRLVR